MYAAMELEDPSDDIAADVSYIRAIFYKGIDVDTLFNPFESDISQAISLDDIKAVPLPSQLQLDEIDSLGMQDLTIMQLVRELEANPERFVTTHVLFSFYFIQFHLPTHAIPLFYIEL